MSDALPKGRHRCPTCGEAVDWSAVVDAQARRTRPFCSPRCQLIDLGRWLDEDYRISRPLGPDDHE